MSGKRYNKEVKKQLTMSLISDELGGNWINMQTCLAANGHKYWFFTKYVER